MTWVHLRVWCAALCCMFAGCAGLAPAAAISTPATNTAQPPQLSGAQLLEIADLLASTGEHVRAGQYLMLAQKRGVSPREVMGRLLTSYAADGQYRLAIEQAEAFLQAHPADVTVRQCLASFYVAVGATLEAIQAYDRVLAQGPDNAAAHFALGSLLREAGMERASVDAHYRAYVALEPHGPHVEEARAGLLKELP